MGINFNYTTPGKYVAICKRSNGKQHYIRTFNFPEKEDEERFKVNGNKVIFTACPEMSVSASWYFMNRVNFEAWVEEVYPMEIFKPILGELDQLVRNAETVRTTREAVNG